jgi:hypothetical protein
VNSKTTFLAISKLSLTDTNNVVTLLLANHPRNVFPNLLLKESCLKEAHYEAYNILLTAVLQPSAAGMEIG